MKLRGTDVVRYPVTNLARAASFDREVPGLPREVYSEQSQWAEFNCGNVTLALWGGAEVPEGSLGGRIALAVDAIHTAREELKTKGARVLSEPRDHSVCWAMEILDPDSNLVILHRRAAGTCGQESQNA